MRDADNTRALTEMRRSFWLNVFVAAMLAGLFFFEAVTLGAWRKKGRALQMEMYEMQSEILRRERARDGVFLDGN